MPASRFTSPFAALSLTLDEKETLSRMMDQIMGETMAMYERFLWQDKGRLDPAVWEPFRERENTRVYKNLLPGGGTGNRDMHLLLTVGTVPGTLNDAMYGVLNPTVEVARIKSAYTKDTLVDMAVLEPIVLPTPEHPYESMNVRWLVKGVPRLVRLVAKHHDSVYIEKTGMRELSNGERVGIHMLHSVTFDKTHVLPQYERFNFSISTVYRQAAPDKIQGYLVSYAEIKESYKTGIVMKSMAEAVISLGNVVDCGQLKKLAWLLRNKHTFAQYEGDAGHPPSDDCAVCNSYHRSVRRGLKSVCAVCNRNTCDRCRVKRTLSLFAPDGQLIQHDMRVCMVCLKTARQLDAMTVVQDEASGYSRSDDRGRRDFDTRSYQMVTDSSTSVTSSVGVDGGRVPSRTDSSYGKNAQGKNLMLTA